MKAIMQNPVVEHAKAKGLYAVKNMEGAPIYVQRGRLSYTSIDCGDDFWQELHDARTKEQNELAVACSMFGWDIPAAARLTD